LVSARGLALHALVALHKGRRERLRSELEGRGLEGRDLAFAFELAHGVVRRERLLDHILRGFAHRGLPKDPSLRIALRLGVYQLLFVPGMPTHAAVHETVELVRQNKGFANAMLRHVAGAVRDVAADPARERQQLPLARERSFELAKPLPEDELERLAIVHSLPDWLAQRFGEQHGIEGLRRIAAAASATPGIYLRAGIDVPRETLRAELIGHEVEVEDCEHERLLRWSGGASPFGSLPFEIGRFVVQDPTAMAAAAAVPCGPGDTVIDLCAAPGTKTTFLAEQVRTGGKVYAFDPDEPRRARIVENVERLRLQSVVEVVRDSSSLQPAHCVLADVPCSNTGVLGRRVEVRGRLKPEVFDELPTLQREILDRAIALTRPGGHVVYSTCSIDREENDAVVAAAQQAHADLELVESHLTLPQAGAHDGGFYAVLRRGG